LIPSMISCLFALGSLAPTHLQLTMMDMHIFVAQEIDARVVFRRLKEEIPDS
jgi:hypothetical protein